MSSQPVSHYSPRQLHSPSEQDRSGPLQTQEEKAQESLRIDQLQAVLCRVMQVIQQDRNLPVERASALVADARRAALAMFPDKSAAFDMLWWPRLQRVMRERYRMQ
jgi:hypothetical protein